jgi:hypothetical protein
MFYWNPLGRKRHVFGGTFLNLLILYPYYQDRRSQEFTLDIARRFACKLKNVGADSESSAEDCAIHIAIHNNVAYDVLPMTYDPSVPFSVVENTLTVTAEAAGSSPVRPRHSFQKS